MVIDTATEVGIVVGVVTTLILGIFLMVRAPMYGATDRERRRFWEHTVTTVLTMMGIGWLCAGAIMFIGYKDLPTWLAVFPVATGFFVIAKFIRKHAKTFYE